MTDLKAAILVAEDEVILRAIAVEMLQDAGFEVFEGSDGIEALEILKANPRIALLVSDIKMPRMDGYALVDAALAIMPELKVLLMSGYAHEPPPELAKAQDMRLLHKPFDLETLCALAAEMTAEISCKTAEL